MVLPVEIPPYIAVLNPQLPESRTESVNDLDIVSAFHKEGEMGGGFANRLPTTIVGISHCLIY